MIEQPTRQLPGIACDECRKRKLRCDRGEPECSTCLNSGVKCERTTKRLARGPRKGFLKELRAHIQSLEEKLHEQSKSSDGEGASITYDDQEENEENSDSGENMQITPTRKASCHTQPQDINNLNGTILSSSTSLEALPSSGPTFLNEWMRAELDQLYFDRAHPVLPVVNKHRYYSWSAAAAYEIDCTHWRLCLQHAMWTLAMAMSSQFESSREQMYRETRQMLEEQDASEDDMSNVHLEQLQAWILVTHYEFLRCSYRRAWTSAGRVFRLAQLLRLHEVDSLQVSNIMSVLQPAEDDYITAEEKRRAFWSSYCLDRFISPHKRLPLTLNEEDICTRLPAPELDFQNGTSVKGSFLSEALVCGKFSAFPPLSESALVSTLCGRAFSHANASGFEQLCGNTKDFWVRHDWIDGLLVTRITSFTQNYSTSSIYADPLLLQTYVILHATTLCLYKAMQPLISQEQSAGRVVEYQKRASLAAREISRVANDCAQLGFFKSHIFIPLPIYLGAEYLITQLNSGALTSSSDMIEYGGQNQEQDQSPEMMKFLLKNCHEALRRVSSVNLLAAHYSSLLDPSQGSQLENLTASL